MAIEFFSQRRSMKHPQHIQVKHGEDVLAVIYKDGSVKYLLTVSLAMQKIICHVAENYGTFFYSFKELENEEN